MTQLFKAETTPDETAENETFRDKLVGDGLKYKDDEALAKAYDHADKYINRLEQELQEARTEIQKRLAVEDYIERMKTMPANDRGNPDTGNPDINPNDLKTEVLGEVQKLLSRSQAERNVERVANELQKTWGKNYSARLIARAKELGLEQEFLANLAETKPDTFLRIVAPTASNQFDGAPPRNQANTQLPKDPERNKAYYDKLKRENPKLYWSRETQAQEHRDAIRLKEKFFE